MNNRSQPFPEPLTGSSLRDARLMRADQLVESLRSTPDLSRAGVQRLAADFDLSPRIVEELLRRGVATGEPRKPILAILKEAVLTCSRALGRVLDSVFASALPFLVLSAVVGLGIIFLASQTVKGDSQESLRTAVRIATSLSVLVLHWACFYRRADFRIAAIGTGFFALLFSGFGAASALRSGFPPMFQTIPGRIVYIVSSGIVFGVFYGTAATIATTFGAMVRLREERSRRMQLSRHELLSRLFEVQERLCCIPERTPKKRHPALRWARRHVALTALLLSLLLAAINYAVAWSTNFNPTNPVNASSAMMLFGVGMFVVLIAIIGLLALWTDTLLKALAVGLLSTVGEFAFSFFPYPGSPTSPERILASLGSAAVLFLIRVSGIGLVRLGLYLTSELSRMRLGEDADEASLIAEYLEIKRRLAAAPVTVLVLVVDAVGSTQLKEGADPLTVEFTFRSYQSWLAEIFEDHKGRSVAQTGDGAIVTFGDPDNALCAAREVLGHLEEFNRTQNRLDAPFQLRLAMHGGEVVADLDQVQFAQVIDVAAHTEKVSPTGGIAVTEPAYRALGEPRASRLSQKVDGYDVFVLE